jgi:hypothetical protein
MQSNTLVTKSSLPGQALQAGVLVAVYFLVLFTAEVVYSATTKASQRFQTLVPYTVSAGDKMIQIRQDAAKFSDAMPLGLSVNERTGMEFAYSFFLFVEPATFSAGTDHFKHVFHKGYAEPWPLMGPGVFINGATNTMRVVMNTYKQPYRFMDVKNIPVEKWFHVILNCYKGGLDIYINGTLASRISFEDSVAYQNFGDLYVFSPQNIANIRGPTVAALADGQHLNMSGAMSGYISKLIYTRYALSATEIQALLNAGPSDYVEQKRKEEPPYLADDWWAHQGR